MLRESRRVCTRQTRTMAQKELEALGERLRSLDLACVRTLSGREFCRPVGECQKLAKANRYKVNWTKELHSTISLVITSQRIDTS